MGVRAVVFPAPNEVILRDDLREPPLGAGDVEVRSTFTGVSVGTERNFLTDGSYHMGFPQLPGYQIAGVVTRVGADVTRFAPGDRIYAHLFWNNPYPGESFVWVGSHAALHTGPADGEIMSLPDTIPDDEASLLSVAAIGLHGAVRAIVGSGRRVLVVGLGIIGQFAAQTVTAMGGRAVGIDPHEARRRVAKDLGAHDVVTGRDEAAAWARLAELGPFDAVVETSSAPAVLGHLVHDAIVRNGSRIVMLGGRERLDYPFNDAQVKELELVHSMHHTMDDIDQVLAFRDAGRLAIGPLITHRLAPSDVPGFWKSVLGGARDYLGVVVDWSRR